MSFSKTAMTMADAARARWANTSAEERREYAKRIATGPVPTRCKCCGIEWPSKAATRRHEKGESD